MESACLERLLELFLEKEKRVERIYMGSSFCSQYYIGFNGYKNILYICKSRGIPVTLVIPIFSEKDIECGKKKTIEICQCLDGIIDEITVNDIGMLSWLNKQKGYHINLGRLFFKDARDCRVPEYYQEQVSPFFLSNIKNDYWRQFHINGVELDPTNRRIVTDVLEDCDFCIGVHMPYCYMTNGNICKFASVHRPVNKKFRPNLSCAMECMHISDTYSGYMHQTDCYPMLHRFGRTLYFKVESVEIVEKNTDRIIYFPIDEWREIKNENIGSVN